MSGNIESLNLAELTSTGGQADKNSFIIVAIEASRTHRYVEASFLINGERVGRITAADNHLDGVISTPAQITTVPVPKGTTWEVRWNATNNEVRIWVITT